MFERDKTEETAIISQINLAVARMQIAAEDRRTELQKELPQRLERFRREVVEYREKQMGSPFLTISWERWQEMQAQLLQSMARIERLVDQSFLDAALFTVLDMQGIVQEILREMSLQIARDRPVSTQVRKKRR